MEKGEAKSDFLIFIGLIGLLFFFWLFTGGPKNFNPSGGFISGTNFVPTASESAGNKQSAIDQYSPVNGLVTVDDVVYRQSPWYGMVKIGRGNARSVFQPKDEYIILSTSRHNQIPITITSWILENGLGRKLIYSSGSTFQGTAKKVIIPTGANLFGGTTAENLGSITLNPGDRAVVTTGSFPQIGPIPIRMSFRTNLCTGYLDALPHYNFLPSLDRSCPDPEKELNAVALEDKCLNYISRLSSCHTPDTEPFLDKTNDGFNFVNSNHLDKMAGFSSQCRNFVLSHYNYRSCLANHLLAENFYGSEWRIFLNQPFELWGKDREVITLYDHEGRLVDQFKY